MASRTTLVERRQADDETLDMKTGQFAERPSVHTSDGVFMCKRTSGNTLIGRTRSLMRSTRSLLQGLRLRPTTRYVVVGLDFGQTASRRAGPANRAAAHLLRRRAGQLAPGHWRSCAAAADAPPPDAAVPLLEQTDGWRYQLIATNSSSQPATAPPASRATGARLNPCCLEMPRGSGAEELEPGERAGHVVEVLRDECLVWVLGS